jgi:hypothetical protein
VRAFMIATVGFCLIRDRFRPAARSSTPNRQMPAMPRNCGLRHIEEGWLAMLRASPLESVTRNNVDIPKRLWANIGIVAVIKLLGGGEQHGAR